MLVIEINNKEYQCPQTWVDITLKQYCDSVDVLNSMPKGLHTITFGKQEDVEKINITTEDSLEFASFYKKWVAFWCQVPESVIGQLPVEVEGGIGVINLYNMLTKFMVLPNGNECPQLETIEYEGAQYMIPESLKQLNGETQPMHKASFDEFYEAAELKRIQGEIKNGNAKILPLLTAIMYRPAIPIRKGLFRKVTGYKIEEYDSGKVEKRAGHFCNLSMDKVWGAYFFFIQLRLTLLRNTLNSSKGEAAKRAMLADLDGI